MFKYHIFNSEQERSVENTGVLITNTSESYILSILNSKLHIMESNLHQAGYKCRTVCKGIENPVGYNPMIKIDTAQIIKK